MVPLSRPLSVGYSVSAESGQSDIQLTHAVRFLMLTPGNQTRSVYSRTEEDPCLCGVPSLPSLVCVQTWKVIDTEEAWVFGAGLRINACHDWASAASTLENRQKAVP